MWVRDINSRMWVGDLARRETCKSLGFYYILSKFTLRKALLSVAPRATMFLIVVFIFDGHDFMARYSADVEEGRSLLSWHITNSRILIVYINIYISSRFNLVCLEGHYIFSRIMENDRARIWWRDINSRMWVGDLARRETCKQPRIW
jgi:hypothetical protein